ncbi:hypothetical protein ACOXXX_11770 [Thalassococcus sp. BH17M4-6]|uniref:hypothetical protein n=1 Tax=Thalassococcus sp. BH17M4-6 TaxID=3413148 RepID=UPI003BC22ED2
MKRLSLFASVLALMACTPPAPLPPDGSDIPWSEAVELFQQCRVETAFQLHDRTVTLTLKDGTTLHTVTPRLDDVVRPGVMPPRCDDVGIIME